jgi:hypothetical protein
VDISYLNICGTLYYLSDLLKWLQPVSGALGFAKASPKPTSKRLCSERGKRFKARSRGSSATTDRSCIAGMTHVRMSPYYPNELLEILGDAAG